MKKSNSKPVVFFNRIMLVVSLLTIISVILIYTNGKAYRLIEEFSQEPGGVPLASSIVFSLPKIWYVLGFFLIFLVLVLKEKILTNKVYCLIINILAWLMGVFLVFIYVVALLAPLFTTRLT